MSLLPELANPYIAALTGGFLYGLVFCTSTCLPYVASYIAGINADFRRGVLVTLFFSSGRIVAYAIMGLLVGGLSLLLSETLQSSFQLYSSLAFSVVSIVIGLTILLRRQVAGSGGCTNRTCERSGVAGAVSAFDVRAFTLGLSRGLLLCAPLLTLLAYSVTFASPLNSLALAVLFGLGTALSPIVLLGGATGWLLNKAPLFRKWISRVGAVALIVLGLVTLVSAITI